MTTESVEQRLNRLENELKNTQAKNEKLQLEVERAQAVNEIRNIMSTLQALHTCCRDAEIGTLFAKRPDTRVYFGGLGYWEGADASDRAGSGLVAMDKVGNMPIHLMCNPVIEVAADGKTAQAIFTAIGGVAQKDKKTGKATFSWEWTRYGDDFIKEDGKWWLWHHHVFDLCRPGWNEPWEKQFEPREIPAGEGMGSAQEPPQYPPTPLDAPYSPDTELTFIPIPKPYETWDPKQMY